MKYFFVCGILRERCISQIIGSVNFEEFVYPLGFSKRVREMEIQVEPVS